jgi:dCMP deaminase
VLSYGSNEADGRELRNGMRLAAHAAHEVANAVADVVTAMSLSEAASGSRPISSLRGRTHSATASPPGRPAYKLVERDKQIERDRYYMGVARAVKAGADCLGTRIGALVVVGDRVVSKGCNGTPTGMTNCTEDGCVRCSDRRHEKAGHHHKMTDRAHVAGAALDRCICVHAEQNAFITAARLGIRLEGGTLYTTRSPCFTCLKEALQVGIERVVYHKWYKATYKPAIAGQYRKLYQHLACGEDTRFEKLGGGRPKI